MMDAGSCHDHAALCADVEAVTEPHNIFEAQFLRVFEDIVLAATASRCRDRIRQDFKLIHEHCQTAFTAVTGVHIQGDKTTAFSHGNANVCRWRF